MTLFIQLLCIFDISLRFHLYKYILMSDIKTKQAFLNVGVRAEDSKFFDMKTLLG